MCQFPTGLVHENRGENPCIPVPLWSSKVGCIPVLFTVDIHHHLSFLGTRRVLSLSTDVSVIISIPAKAGGKQQPRSSCWKRCCSARFSMVRHGGALKVATRKGACPEWQQRWKERRRDGLEWWSSKKKAATKQWRGIELATNEDIWIIEVLIQTELVFYRRSLYFLPGTIVPCIFTPETNP